jgi:hypothetical protein
MYVVNLLPSAKILHDGNAYAPAANSLRVIIAGPPLPNRLIDYDHRALDENPVARAAS